jgi:hypothetical protein
VAKKAVRQPVKRTTGGAATTPSVKFGPAKRELADLREKLQHILDAEGDSLTIRDILDKIEKLDRLLICQVDMTRSF